jgi:nonribosomal peptide synthetase protein BlmVIII
MLQLHAAFTPDVHRGLITEHRPETRQRSGNLSMAWEPPTNDIELRLSRLWEQLLGIDGVGIDDDFFALGGDSLVALRLLAEIREEFGAEPVLGQFFERPTIRQLAAIVATALATQGHKRSAGDSSEEVLL